MKSEPGPPMTPGGAAAAGVRLIVWSGNAAIRSSPDPAEMAARYRAETPVLEWRDDHLRWSDQLGLAHRERLVCSCCGGRRVDFMQRASE
jgi:hypothetical protein